MFPTTVWTRIHRAGADEADALQSFAEVYRTPVLAFIRSRGFKGEDAEDVCQDVFLRLLAGDVLARADSSRGRFRSLLLSVASHVIVDRYRKRRREFPTGELEIVERDADFDRAWVLYLLERATARLREESRGYYEVLKRHLGHEKPDRQKLWIARRKLIALMRAEIAGTCTSHAEFEEEVAYLSGYLEGKKSEKK